MNKKPRAFIDCQFRTLRFQFEAFARQRGLLWWSGTPNLGHAVPVVTTQCCEAMGCVLDMHAGRATIQFVHSARGAGGVPVVASSSSNKRNVAVLHGLGFIAGRYWS
jgi:hypothetical protein